MINFLKLKEIILKNENEFLEKARFYDSSGKYLRVDHTKEIEKYTKRNDELDKYIQILFEQILSRHPKPKLHFFVL